MATFAIYKSMLLMYTTQSLSITRPQVFAFSCNPLKCSVLNLFVFAVFQYMTDIFSQTNS